MGRLTKRNKHGQVCSNGRATRREILERCAFYEEAEAVESQAEIKRLKILLNKALTDLAVECCTCMHQESELCKNCNNQSKGRGNKCLWEWRGARVGIEKSCPN